MSYSEANTGAKLIDPAIHKCGWTEDMIRCEETAGSIEIIGGKARRRLRGKMDLHPAREGQFQHSAGGGRSYRGQEGYSSA